MIIETHHIATVLLGVAALSAPGFGTTNRVSDSKALLKALSEARPRAAESEKV